MIMPLTMLWLIPLIGALVCACLGSKAKYAALSFSVAFLAGSGIVAWFQHSATSELLSSRIWFVGLVLTAAVPVWETVRNMLKGEFAADVVAILAIVSAAALYQPFAGLVVVIMLTGGAALERYAEGRAGAAVAALEQAAPRQAHVRDGDGSVRDT